jgi:hypothetical protein
MRKTDAYIGDVEIPDGQSVKVRLSMMDSLQRAMMGHRSGYVRLSDAQVAARERVRAKWIKQLGDAWRTDARRKRPDDDDEDDDEDEVQGAAGQAKTDPRKIGRSAVDARAAATAAYYQMVQRLQDAWRMPRDGGEPDAATQLLRGHLRTEPDNDAQSRRDRAWSQYRDQLGNAWRTTGPPADPGRADELERQRKSENWMHGA